MDNGSIKGFGNVAAVLWPARINRTSCVSELIVGDQMDCPVNVKFRNFTQNEWLINNSLSTNSWIPMDLNIYHFVVSMIMLLRSGLPHRNRILCLQMWRIMDHSYFYILIMVLFDDTLRNMWCHIIDDCVQLLRSISLAADLSEQVSRWVLEDVGQEVESTTMGHTKYHMLVTLLGRFLK